MFTSTSLFYLNLQQSQRQCRQKSCRFYIAASENEQYKIQNYRFICLNLSACRATCLAILVTLSQILLQIKISYKYTLTCLI